MQNNVKQAVKAVDTYQICVNWYGKHRMSPEYSTIQEAHANLLPFLEKFQGKYLSVTFTRNTRYVAV